VPTPTQKDNLLLMRLPAGDRSAVLRATTLQTYPLSETLPTANTYSVFSFFPPPRAFSPVCPLTHCGTAHAGLVANEVVIGGVAFVHGWPQPHAAIDQGPGGALPDLKFQGDKPAQAILDRQTGRPGPNHVVLGASQHEDLVFDLPRDVEQPGLVFLAGNNPAGLLDMLFGSFWQPHRFNLRYD